MTVGVNNLYNTDISAEILRLKKIFPLLFLQTLNEHLISLRFLWIHLRRKKTEANSVFVLQNDTTVGLAHLLSYLYCKFLCART